MNSAKKFCSLFITRRHSKFLRNILDGRTTSMFGFGVRNYVAATKGVLLFPWTSNVRDDDAFYNTPAFQTKTSDNEFETAFTPSQTPPGNTSENDNSQTYYQILIDERDWPYIRVQKDDVCLLRKTSVSRMHLLPLNGFGHAAHEDILPYSATEAVPFKHGYFEQFFDVTRVNGWRVAPHGDSLQSWRNQCLPYLKFSTVYRRTTHNIRITVIPYYLGYGFDAFDEMGRELAEKSKSFVWRYSIRLENFGEDSVVLREREWEIVDVYGRREVHKGRGVIGTEPRLSKAEPAFQYSSFMYLRAPRGTMSGAYTMQREDGTLFRCIIPQFELNSFSNTTEDGA